MEHEIWLADRWNPFVDFDFSYNLAADPYLQRSGQDLLAVTLPRGMGGVKQELETFLNRP